MNTPALIFGVLAASSALAAPVPREGVVSSQVTRETLWPPPTVTMGAVPTEGHRFHGGVYAAFGALGCEGPECVKETLYGQYRRQLIQQGYAPAKMRPAADDVSDAEEIRKTWPELLACWGTDHTSCQFVFLDRKRRYVIVETLGEWKRGMRAVAMGKAGPKQLPELRKHGG